MASLRPNRRRWLSLAVRGIHGHFTATVNPTRRVEVKLRRSSQPENKTTTSRNGKKNIQRKAKKEKRTGQRFLGTRRRMEEELQSEPRNIGSLTPCVVCLVDPCCVRPSSRVRCLLAGERP